MPHPNKESPQLISFENQVPIIVRKSLSQVEVRLLLAPLSVSECCTQDGNFVAALEAESDVRGRLGEVLATPGQAPLKTSYYRSH